jgi:hypothetical protein
MPLHRRRTDFSATVYHECEDAELIFEIGFECTHRSFPGSFNPIDGGDPPEGAEFEYTYIMFAGAYLTWGEFVEGVGGEAQADALFEEALTQAIESGEF